VTDRERQRAEVREARAQQRSAMAQARVDRRAAERDQASQVRQQSREARQREVDERMAALRPTPAGTDDGAESAPRRRASGAIRRTGDVRIERDTRHYATRVDIRRIRELSRRGASVSGLATVFGITAEEVEAALADPQVAGE
jgi:hypothetical protein